VTLIDALADPTGATPLRSESGKPVENGVRGFWKDYPNINALVAELGLREDEVFTPFTNSSFYSPDGLEATAPVFTDSAYATLPSPLGQMLATFPMFERLPVADRASIAGLLYAILDLDRDAETFAAYDRMSAHDLFITMGLSKRLVDDFLRPTLLVGLFKPPEELSAAVVCELLYFYALAHQDSFDVRWIKRKSINELLIAPLAQRLVAQYGLRVKGGCYVQALELSGCSLEQRAARRDAATAPADAVRARALSYVTQAGGGGSEIATGRLDNLTAVVLAIGVKGMRALVAGSKDVARECPELAAAASLQGIDVISVRLWLDRVVRTRSPANVFSRFEGLRGSGGTFFMLDQLQCEPETQRDNWGGAEPQGSLVACDFYNAGALLPLSDDDLVELLMGTLLPAAVPAFAEAKVVDRWIARSQSAVSWFSPGSFRQRPPLQTSVRNLVCAGDWVRMGEREHGAKGLCQERAYASGLEAANALGLGRQIDVVPVRPAERQVAIGRQLNKGLTSALALVGLASRWVR
jgi:uncharacterized protein with NAD-binding domain and iron-sulfur cluster